MKHQFLLIFFTLSNVCFGQIENIGVNDVNFKAIVEKKGLMYYKADTTLVTGRVVRYNKKKEAKSYVEVVNGKPQSYNWKNFNKEQKEMKESDLGNILVGAAFATGVAMAVTGNDINVPIGDNINPRIKKFYKDVGIYEENRSYEDLNTISESDPNRPENGPYDEYYYDNELKKTRNYIESKEDGIWEEFYENGELMSRVNYLDGKKVGRLDMYHSNGHLKGRVNYKDGKEDGEMMVYGENGEIILIGFFKDGIQKGDWHYFENGKLVKIENFD